MDGLAHGEISKRISSRDLRPAVAAIASSTTLMVQRRMLINAQRVSFVENAFAVDVAAREQEQAPGHLRKHEMLRQPFPCQTGIA